MTFTVCKNLERTTLSKTKDVFTPQGRQRVMMGYYPRIMVLHNLDDIRREMALFGITQQSQELEASKSLAAMLKIEKLPPKKAKAIVDSAKAVGISTYLKVDGRQADAQLLIVGSLDKLHSLALKLADPSFYALLGKQIHEMLHDCNHHDFKLHCGAYTLNVGQRTHVMGVLNVTPDSFSDGGKYLNPDNAIAHAKELVAQGADIIDIGGESSRPGSEPITVEEELDRILPVLEGLLDEVAVPLSVDTYKAQVAEAALRLGAHIINDISGLRFDPDMAPLIAQYGVPVVIMHIRGTPQNMQQHPSYTSLMGEITEYLQQGIELACTAGINPEQIIIDPGIGFGKTVDHNLHIINRLSELKCLGKPIMVGTSRKSFIGQVLGAAPEQRQAGTAASVSCAISKGAHIVRVHDVASMVRVARLTDAIKNASPDN